jgi:DNA replication protein DnaC
MNQQYPIDLLLLMPDEQLLTLSPNPFCDCETGKAMRRMVERRVNGWGEFTLATSKLNEKMRMDAVRERFIAAEVPPRYQAVTLASLANQFAADSGKVAAVKAATEFIKNKGQITMKGQPPFYGLWLYGDYGVGKTSVAAACFNALLPLLDGALWLPYSSFLDQIRHGYSLNDGSSTLRKQAAMKAPLLLIDDLGSTVRDDETTHTKDVIWEVVYHRNAYNLPTLITSNLSRNDIRKHFDDRVYQRLVESLMIVEVGGKCLRRGGA